MRVGRNSVKGADIAGGGLCVVCKAMDGKDVPGSARFTARYKELRYLFPAAGQREMFLAGPAKFVGAADRAARKPAPNNQDASTRVSVSGVTGCAACAFRIHTLGFPQELGLAVDAGDGRVFVVEDAHRLYPDVYEARFNRLRVELFGDAVKSDSLVTWVKPESLTVAPKRFGLSPRAPWVWYGVGPSWAHTIALASVAIDEPLHDP